MTSLIVSTLAVLASGQATTDVRLLRYPAISGDTVVFTYAGDLWSWNTAGGLSRRLTTHAGEELRAKISPDGKWVVFTGAYDGAQDLYLIPIEGGEPRRLTYEPGPKYALSWTPDGKIAYVTGHGGISGNIPRLMLLSPDNAVPEATPILEVNQGTFTPDGNTFVYNRMSGQNQWWRNYRGGRQPFISFYNVKTNAYSEIPHKREMSAFPMAVGNSVYYVSDRNQRTLNLYRWDIASKKDTQLTNFTGADIRWPSTDGKSVVYERDGYLYRYDIASNKAVALKPEIVSDNWGARPALRNLSQSIEGISLSPSGNRIAIVARGELFSVPAKSGETRNISETRDARERLAAWSPDGKNIAYVSDKSGENAVYIEPQMGGEATQLTTQSGMLPNSLTWSPDGKTLSFTTRSYELYLVDVATKKLTRAFKANWAANIAYDWSPDSKWLAVITDGKNQFGAVSLYEIATGKMNVINEGMFLDTDVAFDQTGKYLYFVSNRSFNPGFGLFEFSLKVEDSARVYAMPLSADLANPLIPPIDEEGGEARGQAGPPGDVRIDLEGLSNRAIPLPMGPGNYGLIAGLNDGLLFAGAGGLQKFDMRSRDVQPILSAPASGISLNPQRTKIAFASGGQVYIQDLRPGLTPGPGRVDLGSLDAVVDPRGEWKQMFWEVWRYERDYFYNPDMNGLDWQAVGKRYANYLGSVNHRLDLSYVLGLLIGELETGHAYVQGFDTPIPNQVPTGLLGADYETSAGKVRFKKIYRGANYEESLRSPLSEPGLNVKDGDYLLSIDGKEVNERVHPNSLLVGKVGRTVVLSISSSATGANARTVRVRPISTEGGIRYNDWVETNRQIVNRLSGGRIGYMHIPNTSGAGAVGLIKGFYSQVDKDAVVVDERYNGGGYIQPWFVDLLGRKMRAKVKDRNGNDWQDAVAIEGPKCLLINGYAGSGGDFFPWMFRQAKLGPLIGTRTWGGLVGIKGGIGLLDGGSVTAPEFGIYDHRTGDWIAENKGVDPDIEIDNRPDLVAAGRDPQLERGVEYLMGELKKGSPEYKGPTFPKIPPTR